MHDNQDRLVGPLRCGWLAHPRRTPSAARVRAWLGTALQVPAGDLVLSRDAHCRPQLGGAQAAFDANWSHSGDHLLVVLGSDVQVGVDLEHVRPRPHALDLARRYYAPEEADWVAGLAGEGRERAFLRLWCAKEALLKAHGRGLAFGLHRLRFIDSPGGLSLVDCDPRLGRPADWQVRELSPGTGYIAAAAWRPLRRDSGPRAATGTGAAVGGVAGRGQRP